MVSTLTPWFSWAASQASTAASSGLVTPSEQLAAQTSWIVKMIQPPPWLRAPSTIFSKVAAVQRVPTDATSIGVRSTNGFAGGMVSAYGQWLHSPAPRSCPVPRPEL